VAGGQFSVASEEGEKNMSSDNVGVVWTAFFAIEFSVRGGV
jgi:hypothetical protein